MNNLKNEIHDYWTNRARGYSEYNQQEMADARQTMWRAKLLDLLGKQFPEREPKEIKILDVGTGPGFFAILLAEAGYQVTAIDYTEEMLKEAQQNACGLEECIVWKTGDAQALDVENNSFDAIVTRNVTWNLPRPDLAYKEWLRVLKPGGMLYNFDADWYGHLYNEEKRNSYEKDRQQTEEQNVEDYYSGTDIEKMEEIARQVFETDRDIDAKEREIENLCLSLLLHQHPVARDLREISAALKMVSDMERIGDQAADIADLSLYVAKNTTAIPETITQMAEDTVRMVTESVDAFVKSDLELCRNVIDRDDVVDDAFNEIKEKLADMIYGGNLDAKTGLDLLMTAKYFERIGDHAVNIAEWVEYSITGQHRNNEHQDYLNN